MQTLDKATITEIFKRFEKDNPNPTGELHFSNPFTLLVAVVLSAQTTDANVNKATEELFKLVDTPEKMVALGEEGLKTYIKTINYYPTKASRIIKLSEILIADYGSKVPDELEELVKLPGVGRKTANVVLSLGFNQATIAVDTHVYRTSRRLGLSKGENVGAVEEELSRVIPKRYLYNAHHWLLLHGRYQCRSRNPNCEGCIVSDLCGKNL